MVKTPQVVTMGPRVSTRAGADGWVEAAPFRAHLRHLMAVADLSATTVAVLVGISPRLAHRLLYGRGGRALRRINPDTARKLLRVTPAEARAVRRRRVPAQATVQHLHQLRDAGWTDGQLAQLVGVALPALDVLLADSNATCSQLGALRAAAEVSLLTSPFPPAQSWADCAA
jgi:hypothetical protein